MAHGKLANAKIANTGELVVYTAPVSCKLVECDIYLNNPDTSTAVVSVAISEGDVPADADWIENGVNVTPNGTMTITSLKLSAGEKVVVKSSVAGPTVRVMGSELTKA